MKKKQKSRPDYQPVNRLEELRFQGSPATIFYNTAIFIVYAVFINFSIDDTAGLIVFTVAAILQVALCAVIGITYNSRMWLTSAFVIFLFACITVAYLSM